MKTNFNLYSLVLVVAGAVAAKATDVAGNEEDQRGLFGGFGSFFGGNEDEVVELPSVGGHCGVLSGHDGNCKEGLECNHFGPIAGRRCTPRKDCVQKTLDSFLARPQFQGYTYKNRILEKAGITEMDIAQELIAGGHGMDFSSFTASAPMQAIRRAINETSHEFDDLGPMIQYCLQAEHGDGGRNLQTQGDVPVVFIGAHIEAGALLDASFSAAWELVNGTFPAVNERVAGRLCGGIELGGGVELSMIALIGFEATDPATFECLNVQTDLDVAGGLGVGVGFGFCIDSLVSTGTFDQQSMYIETTLGFGFGAGLGVSFCSSFSLV